MRTLHKKSNVMVHRRQGLVDTTFSHKCVCVCYLSGAIGNLDHGGCGARCEDTSLGKCSDAKVIYELKHEVNTRR